MDNRAAIRTVPVSMPEWVWGRLVTIAQHERTGVGDLIADALLRVLEKDEHALEHLENELNTARRSGWRVPRRGSK